jgi:hypothetical protein
MYHELCCFLHPDAESERQHNEPCGGGFDCESVLFGTQSVEASPACDAAARCLTRPCLNYHVSRMKHPDQREA